MREVELEQFSDQVNSLNKDSMLGRMVEEDLSSMLSVLEDGVETGVVKVSDEGRHVYISLRMFSKLKTRKNKIF